MAEEKDDKPKSRAAKLYDGDKGKSERKSAEKAPEPKAEGGKDTNGDREQAEMLKRHENERRDMHGRHRTEHRAIEESSMGQELVHKKIGAHHRHRAEMAQMHEKHEKELIDKLAAMHEPGSEGDKIIKGEDKEAA